jgi:hypothetical protein
MLFLAGALCAAGLLTGCTTASPDIRQESGIVGVWDTGTGTLTYTPDGDFSFERRDSEDSVEGTYIVERSGDFWVEKTTYLRQVIGGTIYEEDDGGRELPEYIFLSEGDAIRWWETVEDARSGEAPVNEGTRMR